MDEVFTLKKLFSLLLVVLLWNSLPNEATAQGAIGRVAGRAFLEAFFRPKPPKLPIQILERATNKGQSNPETDKLNQIKDKEEYPVFDCNGDEKCVKDAFIKVLEQEGIIEKEKPVTKKPVQHQKVQQTVHHHRNPLKTRHDERRLENAQLKTTSRFLEDVKKESITAIKSLLDAYASIPTILSAESPYLALESSVLLSSLDSSLAQMKVSLENLWSAYKQAKDPVVKAYIKAIIDLHQAWLQNLDISVTNLVSTLIVQEGQGFLPSSSQMTMRRSLEASLGLIRSLAKTHISKELSPENTEKQAV